MPAQVNSNYSANFQKFVDFANKAYATKGEDIVPFNGSFDAGEFGGEDILDDLVRLASQNVVQNA